MVAGQSLAQFLYRMPGAASTLGGFVQVRHFFVRNSDAPELIELFLVAGIASVLAIRGALAATGYPQLGGDGLHIAHMLWGGLFMTLAMLLLFAALGRAAQRLAAILGGIGFGTFIDELGKFITSDNNYFYEPTIGLIYIIFIAIFLVLEAFRRQAPGPTEALANAFNQLELAAGRPLDAETKRTTLDLLAKSDKSDPVVQGLSAFVQSIEPQPVPDMGFYFQARDLAVSLYSRVVLSRWFRPILVGFFLVRAFVQIAIVLLVALVGILASDVETFQLSFTDIATLCSVAVSGVLTLFGIFQLKRSRLAAYRWFVHSILVSIFVIQVFTFLESELSALWGFAIDILVYTALKIMIEQEQLMVSGVESESATVGGET